MRPDLERRALNAVELRAEPGEGDAMPVIVGHAAVFDVVSEDLGWYRERIDRGAFADTIKQDDICALFNHDTNRLLGRNRAGTLELSEDDTGLWVRIEPPDTTYARDLVAMIERGDISGMSIGFRTLTDEWNMEDGDEVRKLKKVKLYDVSPVTYPAYPQTDVALRSLEAHRRSIQPPEAWRRNLARRRLDLTAVS